MTRRIRHLRVGLNVLAFTFLVAMATSASAQDGFDVQLFRPMPGQTVNHFTVSSALILEHLDWEIGVLANFADDPLVLRSDSDERLVNVVEHQLALDVMLAIGFFDRLELGVDLPIVLLQESQDAPQIAYTATEGAGVGDLRIVPRLLLFSTESDDDPWGASLGLLASFFVPIGSQDAFQGEGFRAEPRLAFDYAFGKVARLSANVGYLFRPDSDFLNIEVDDMLTYGLAAAFRLADWLYIVPEVRGETSLLAEEIDTEELPLEGTIGAKIYPIESLLIQAGFGTGLIEGVGAPDWRVFFGIAFSPPAVHDTDGDGYLDPDDGCPLEPEDFDSFEDSDGCPDPDNDGDGICDPWVSEQGLQDRYSRVCTGTDQCPNEPESINGYEDEDGCPDSPPLIEETRCERIGLRDKVYFDTDSDRIQERSFDLLNQVAAIMVARPDLQRVRIEGHTDSRGSNRHNLDLSQRRAESVNRYLLEQGVSAERLVPVGYGEDQPVADNGTTEGRAENRRVEFIILQQEGCEEIVPPY